MTPTLPHVPLGAWVESGSGYSAPGGFRIDKIGRFWVATLGPKELARDEFLSNLMLELCK